jgi:hypothetical protein
MEKESEKFDLEKTLVAAIRPRLGPFTLFQIISFTILFSLATAMPNEAKVHVYTFVGCLLNLMAMLTTPALKGHVHFWIASILILAIDITFFVIFVNHFNDAVVHILIIGGSTLILWLVVAKRIGDLVVIHELRESECRRANKWLFLAKHSVDRIVCDHKP